MVSVSSAEPGATAEEGGAMAPHFGGLPCNAGFQALCSALTPLRPGLSGLTPSSEEGSCCLSLPLRPSLPAPTLVPGVFLPLAPSRIPRTCLQKGPCSLRFSISCCSQEKPTTHCFTHICFRETESKTGKAVHLGLGAARSGSHPAACHSWSLLLILPGNFHGP